MLNVPTPFPHAGSIAYLDDEIDGRTVTEQVRIQAAPDALGMVPIAIRSRRYPREIASGFRRVHISQLRETEQPAPVAKPAPARKSARRK